MPSKAPIFSNSNPGGMFSLVNREYHPGSVFFVDASNSKAADTAGFGFTPERPRATIDSAIALCTANKGDVIYVLPGHTETISASITADIAGVTIKGVMAGTLKPTVTLDNTASEINVTAANVTIKNLRLVSSVNSLVNFFDLDAAVCRLEGIDMVTSAATEAVCFINIATTIDDFDIIGCTAYQPSDPEGTTGAAGTGFIYVVDSERINVKGCTVIGNFETAFVHNKTTKCLDLVVEDCRTRMDLSDSVQFLLVAAVTGDVRGCTMHSPNGTDVSVAQVIGTIGATFWIAPTTYFSNDSAAGGELMVNSAVACS